MLERLNGRTNFTLLPLYWASLITVVGWVDTANRSFLLPFLGSHTLTHTHTHTHTLTHTHTEPPTGHEALPPHFLFFFHQSRQLDCGSGEEENEAVTVVVVVVVAIEPAIPPLISEKVDTIQTNPLGLKSGPEPWRLCILTSMRVGSLRNLQRCNCMWLSLGCWKKGVRSRFWARKVKRERGGSIGKFWGKRDMC